MCVCVYVWCGPALCVCQSSELIRSLYTGLRLSCLESAAGSGSIAFICGWIARVGAAGVLWGWPGGGAATETALGAGIGAPGGEDLRRGAEKGRRGARAAAARTRHG